MKRPIKIGLMVVVFALLVFGSARVWGVPAVLRIVAFWVVFGLPFLLAWRTYMLFKTENQPRNFYVGGVIMFLGIAIWIPYALMRRIMGMDISVFPFLISHLACVSYGARLKNVAVRKQTGH